MRTNIFAVGVLLFIFDGLSYTSPVLLHYYSTDIWGNSSHCTTV